MRTTASTALPAWPVLASMLLLCACGSSQVDPEAGPLQVEAAAASAPAPEAAPPPAEGIPLPAGDLLALGSVGARDDLYCSAVIYNANPEVSDALAPVDEALLRKAQMMGFIIGEAGINRLISEGAAHATHARAIAEAYAVQVARDARSGSLRLSADTCMARAQAIPVPE